MRFLNYHVFVNAHINGCLVCKGLILSIVLGNVLIILRSQMNITRDRQQKTTKGNAAMQVIEFLP